MCTAGAISSIRMRAPQRELAVAYSHESSSQLPLKPHQNFVIYRLVKGIGPSIQTGLIVFEGASLPKARVRSERVRHFGFGCVT
mmetsp:Transcript_40522/g.108459  ORF Transcript_40522/g.108459 Transcript_40522/m.108459 type:complete len:84 (-) Transcript_40522:1215-1466(-)